MEAIMPALVHLIPYELHCRGWSVHRWVELALHTLRKKSNSTVSVLRRIRYKE